MFNGLKLTYSNCFSSMATIIECACYVNNMKFKNSFSVKKKQHLLFNLILCVKLYRIVNFIKPLKQLRKYFQLINCPRNCQNIFLW